MLTASILREVPSAKNSGEASMYRLVLVCNADTREGEMQVAWAPTPRAGTLIAAVDGNPPVNYKVDGAEKMGNGSQATAGPAALSLAPARLPSRTLSIGNLFPDETVVFPFGDLPQAARQSLAVCFTESNSRP